MVEREVIMTLPIFDESGSQIGEYGDTAAPNLDELKLFAEEIGVPGNINWWAAPGYEKMAEEIVRLLMLQAWIDLYNETVKYDR